MAFDIFQSRRTYNIKCTWWSRDERDEYPTDEYKSKRIPSGYFWAKEVNAEQVKNNVVGGTFRFDVTHVTIKTPDNCSGIKSEDIIEYQGSLWRVDDIQKKKARMQSTEFSKVDYVPHYWYLSLVK